MFMIATQSSLIRFKITCTCSCVYTCIEVCSTVGLQLNSRKPLWVNHFWMLTLKGLLNTSRENHSNTLNLKSYTFISPCIRMRFKPITQTIIVTQTSFSLIRSALLNLITSFFCGCPAKEMTDISYFRRRLYPSQTWRTPRCIAVVFPPISFLVLLDCHYLREIDREEAFPSVTHIWP